MTRRGLLGSLAAGVAAAVLDPERLLWVPGRKWISIPAPSKRLSITQLGEVLSIRPGVRIGNLADLGTLDGVLAVSDGTGGFELGGLYLYLNDTWVPVTA